ncbi:hypothetical protein DL769_006218 [Monosporascus sp. CRB-8-3]|nr:hypothetical protein DL769_006218 [Monosporascus sp. CRB-8-3]
MRLDGCGPGLVIRVAVTLGSAGGEGETCCKGSVIARQRPGASTFSIFTDWPDPLLPELQPYPISAFTGKLWQDSKSLEVLRKTDFNDRGNEHGGLRFEQDPVRHRRVAEQVPPALRPPSTTVEEPRLHRYFDDSMGTMGTVGWWGCRHVGVVQLAGYGYLGGDDFYPRNEPDERHYPTGPEEDSRFSGFIPLSAVKSTKDMNKTSRESYSDILAEEQDRKGSGLLRAAGPQRRHRPYGDPREVRRLEMAATQLLFAGSESVSSWYYGTLLSLLTEPAALATPAGEIRAAFTRFEDIRPTAATPIERLTLASKSRCDISPNTMQAGQALAPTL